MSLLGAILLGLLVAASIVQTLLLARTMIAGREASRRLAALEEDFRLMMAHLPQHGEVTAAIDPTEALSPNLPVVDLAVDTSRGPLPPLGGWSSQLGPGQDNDLPASRGPVRVVGGLNT